MKSKTLPLLIICASFMVTTIETAIFKCNNPIIYNNLDLPVTINLAQLSFGKGFLPNKSIVINGVVLENPDQFVVNLFEDGIMQETADIPFHFKPLFRRSPPYVARNNWIKNRGWGREDDSWYFPFGAGRPFTLEFVAAPKNTIRIYDALILFAAFSRVDLSKISQLYIDGGDTIRVNNLTLCPNQDTTATPTPRSTTEEPTPPTDPSFPSCLYPIDIANPKLPLTIDLVKVGFGEGFLPNKSIEIYGRVLEKPETFNLYLMEGNFEDTAMPFVFKSYLYVTDPFVNLNNWINSTRMWGQRKGFSLPLRTGQRFSLKFFAAPKNTTRIYLNNQHLAAFSRVDLSKISQLYIEGENTIKVDSMTLCTKIQSPPTPPVCLRQIELNNLTIPSIIDLEEKGFGRGLYSSKHIIIFGTPTAPTNFDISLVEEGVPEETADIPFHFSADFATKEVITDTWVRGTGWIGKESIEYLPFTVGQEFELTFFATAVRDGLQVHVDKKPFVSFHRSNLKEITQLEIIGAIKVSSVVLCPY